ncbi:MerR family DNA-binding transcriptional regulator [Paralimibaculum aggregatum]|uniref:MerR family DNA-binding transcriptional regulator n=1 Tax=Paralimibaculum aggregatum TaxID=3036245 RepID=A0ABQ6LRS4_9RHOB|nr:MerR family DNA-binding transcriptional regulator [Limibaculum sp. NKW23]GMG84081.1 MerR family DNA-binding transcriptional regulator [Limibaculum sp. NKW23]
MPDRTYSIRELCDEFDVTPRTLRYYESKELLAPHRQGQRRLFTVSDRARLKLILRGKRFGFSLAEIKDLLDLYDREDGQVAQLSATLSAAKRHRAELAAKRDELEAALVDLDAQMDQIEALLAAKTARKTAP